MSDIPYTVNVGKIKTYFEKFQQAGVPQKVDSAWLKSIGLWAGGNDGYIIGVSKFIGFIDSSNAPTELWKFYKDPTRSRPTLAKGIRQGYQELFDTYPDANSKDKETLYAFFSAKTGKAKKTVDYMVSTFISLCQLADFGAVEVERREEEGKKHDESEEKGKKKQQTMPQMPEGFAINLNIQITLPVTEDAKVYENIFKTLREQLFKSE